MIWISADSTATDGPHVGFSCPGCECLAFAPSYELRGNLRLFFIPFLSDRETFVACPACGVQHRVPLSLDELKTVSARELRRRCVGHDSFLTKFAAITSLVFCWVPFFGVGLSVLALLLSVRRKRWPMYASLVACTISAIVFTLFLLFVQL